MNLPIPDKPIRVWGIDLGTTNSAISEVVWQPGMLEPKCHCIELSQKSETGLRTDALVPSVVAYHGSETWVGYGAKQLLAYPNNYRSEQNIFAETKNEIGLQKTYARAPEETKHPWHVAGHILKFIHEQAERQYGSRSQRTVVTVPASFQINQRQDTIQAARQAGISIGDFDLLDEPTAALIDYLLSPETPFAQLLPTKSFFQLLTEMEYWELEKLADETVSTSTLRNHPYCDELLNRAPTKEELIELIAGSVVPLDDHPSTDKCQDCTVMVFDFGGGTCDISTVKLTSEQNGLPKASMLAASRYHRIGGSDIDRAIVHQLMIPELLRQHDIESLALSFTDKKKTLEPILMPRAEALKIALCREIWRLRGHGKWNDSAKSTTRTEQPEFTVKIGARDLRYSKPSLNAVDFEKVLERFLDRDALYARETDYVLSCSIFAPIMDSLERANLSPTDITSVLLVGGSSLIPQVQDAVREFFGTAEIWAYKEYMQTQLAVSRGAAWHAYYMEVTGRPFIQPVVPETIALQTEDRDQHLVLVPSGANVPYPADGSFKEHKATLPKSGLETLTMEVVAKPSDQRLFLEHWKLPEGTDEGDSITIKARLTSNSQLEIHACLNLDPDSVFEKTADNPLVNVVNPSEERLKIQVLEEELRSTGHLGIAYVPKLVSLARLYATLSYYEKAIESVGSALRLLGRPDSNLLNLQGIFYSDLGDLDRAAKCYVEAANAKSTNSTPFFNLSLAYGQRGNYLEAEEAIDRALGISPNNGPYLVRKGQILKRLGRDAEARQALLSAGEAFPSSNDINTLDEFEINWYDTWARLQGDTECIAAVEAEKKRRRTPGESKSSEPSGHRPKLSDNVEKS